MKFEWKKLLEIFQTKVSAIFKTVTSCWMLKVARDTLLGFLILGCSLYLVGLAFPRFYNFITQWANAPLLAGFDSCEVKEKLHSDVSNLSAYRISIKISDSRDSTFDLVFSVNGPGISVYEKDQKDILFNDDRNAIMRRFISSERSRSQDFVFDVTVNHKEQGTTVYELGKLSTEECPLEVHPIRRKK